MANTGFKGLGVRQTGTAVLYRALLLQADGTKLTTGTTTLKLYEYQSDGSLKSYDFSSNTFKTTALTTETLALTHQTGNNGTTNTGVWTAVQSTLTGFTVGAVYLAEVENTGAYPPVQCFDFQYGSAEGDLVVTANGTGIGELNADLKLISGQGVTSTGTFSFDNLTTTNTTIASQGNTALSTLATASALSTLTTTVGAAGAGLTALAQASIWTSTVAGRIDTTVSSRSTYAGGAVASVTGDVAGKVLGGGASAITGTGAQVADPLATALPGSYGAGTAGYDLQRLLDIASGDHYIDKNVTPWAFVVTKAGTGAPGVGTELIRKPLYDVNGSGVTSTGTILGQAHQ